MRSQDYAELSEHSYDRQATLATLVNQKVMVGGFEYRILAHAERSSGYQGTIYQRTDTSEIVVAHRGTEFGKLRTDPLETVKDLVLADGGMVVARTNRQADDAIEFTQLARELAQRQARHGVAPEVTVTGHSLGGTLAQITAHHFDLRGETFNAFGAASLDRRIPQGGNAVLNHVMAADFVSAASPHYGQVRVYALPGEVERLQGWGYENSRSNIDWRYPEHVAVRSLGSHDMNHFLPVDGQGRRDTSVLESESTRTLAERYDPMFDKYRADIMAIRRAATLTARGAPGLLEDTIDGIRGPLPPGEPARREEQQRRRGASLDEGALPDMRNPGHPANDRYRQAFAGVTEVDRTLGRVSDANSERLAASLTAASVSLRDIGSVALNDAGTRAFAMETPRGPLESRNRADVEVATAVQRPVEDSTRDWQEATRVAALEQTRTQSLERESRTVAGPAIA